jgi:rhodanese-related sulfurtransferase
MNGPSGIEKNGPRTLPAMLAIFGAAVVIGLAFNLMSPLGVRPTQTMLPSNAPEAAGPLYENDTLAVSLGGFSPDRRPATAAQDSIYENETTGMHLDINRATDPVQPPPQPGVRTVSWLETKKLLSAGQIVLVDARASVFYETGHIPGAISLPAVGAPPETFAAFAARYPRGTPLVVYCGSEQCPLAAQLIKILIGSMGYTDVRDMPGGFVEYRATENHAAGGGAI